MYPGSHTAAVVRQAAVVGCVKPTARDQWIINLSSSEDLLRMAEIDL